MKPTAFNGIGILMATLSLLMVLTVGCLVPEYGVGRDIMVFKVDAGGTEQWQTVIDTGGDDSASSIVQTADGGYIVGGEVLPWREDQSYGVFRLDGNGSSVWNATGGGGPIFSVAETDRGIIVAVGESGTLLLDPAGKILESDAEADSTLRSVIGTADGGFVAAGADGKDLLVLKRDRNLTEEWRKTYGTDDQDGAKTIIQTSDGEYLVGGTTYLPDRNGSDVWLLRLDSSGDLIRDATLGSPSQYNTVAFMNEAPGGGCAVIYNDVTLEEVVFDRAGSVIEERTLNASMPIVRTAAGGYVYGTITYRSAPRFLILPGQVGVPHIMKLNSDGMQEWNTELNTTFELIGSAVSVIQTDDGGYALLVNRYNYPEEPR
ncbi:hypothetical protein [Methanoculleus sp.]|uniref:hypothetical protein n=1 Tax=Methanoculleus sp. TaxID=90427 RepID=UPI002FC7A769